MKRRNFIRTAGMASLTSVALLAQACGSSDNPENTTDDGDTGDNTNGNDSTNNGPTDSTTDTTATDWVSGGTEKITVAYPDDSIFEQSATCNISLAQSTTLGPCYFEDNTGEDISEGLSGLPMQLCLRLVDIDCNPLSNHQIDVWHCDNKGVYSGDTTDSQDAGSFAGNFCTGGDTQAASSTWYRGMLTTDPNGRVNFKTCFPGWYRGRTIHIHFKVTAPNGQESVISQLAFTDELARQICTTHVLYSDRGEQDTTLAGGRDTVFPSSDNDSFVMQAQTNSDKTLLAWHTVRVQ